MPRLLVIDDRDQTVEMVHRQLPQFDTVTRCDRRIPCQVCEERDARLPAALRARLRRGGGGAGGAATRCPTWSCSICTSRCPRRSCCPRTSRSCPRPEGPKDGAAVDEPAPQPGPADPRTAARELPDAAGGHADHHRLRPRRRAARRSAGLPLRERGGRQPQPGRGDLARAGRAPHRAGRRRSSGDARPAMAELRRQLDVLARSPLPVLIEGETGTGKSFLAEQVIHPRSGAKGPLVVTDLSTVPPRAAGGAPVRRAARRLHGRRRGSRGRVRAGPRRHAVPRRDREPGSRAAAAAAAGARARRGHAPRRHAPAPRDAQAGRGDQRGRRGAGARRDASAPISTCASTRRRGCACRRCASAREDLPELVRFAFLEALRVGVAAPAGARVPGAASRRPTTSTRARTWSCSAGRAPAPRGATRSRCSSAARRWRASTAHDWPGNHRELKLLAANALVFCLTRTSTRRRARSPPRARARGARRPRSAGHPPARRERRAPRQATAGRRGPRRRPPDRGRGAAAASFARVSADVERQYLRALFERAAAISTRMARELLGPERHRPPGAPAPRTSWACGCATCAGPRR